MLLYLRLQSEPLPRLGGRLGLLFDDLLILPYILWQRLPFVFPHDPLYWGSLLNLAIPGTVIALLCYLKLVYNIGADRAGYATVLSQVIALLISSFVESYKMSLLAFLGIALILAGNILILKKKPILTRN